VEIGGTRGANWLNAVTDADALCVVVREFDDPSVFHPHDTVDPIRDARELETEFILADLGLVETRLERIALFLALLELMRLGAVNAWQTAPRGEIQVARRGDGRVDG